MTEKLYMGDSYLKEFEARVVAANGNQLVLDRTAFYPAEGGQPSDSGTLTVNGETYSVTGLKKEGDNIIHVLDREISAKPGDAAKGRIDWDRRYACMRYHTALHALDSIFEKYAGSSGMSTGNQIYPDRARMDIDMPEMNREKAVEMIERANAVLEEGHSVKVREISAEEARKIPNLAKTETGARLLQGLERVRVVEIEGVDTQADGGTHVRNTSEIGTMKLRSYENKGSRRKRIEIVLE